MRALLLLAAFLASIGAARAQSVGNFVQGSFASAPTAAIDGSATATGGGTQTCVVTLTTTKNPDVIILQSKSTPTSGDGSISTVADTAGLTWALRKKQTYATQAVAEEWYAIASGTLSSDAITVTMVSNSNYASRCTAFGVSGANTGAPFDGDASIPAGGGQTGGTSQALTISTASAKTMLVAVIENAASTFGTMTRPAGFAQILATGTSNDSSYSVVSSAQSSVSESFSWTGGAANTGLIIDAVVSN